jgi:hypothetical protein
MSYFETLLTTTSETISLNFPSTQNTMTLLEQYRLCLHVSTLLI